MDTLKAMRIAVAIAERGSLTAAADSQDLSLPVVVRTLAALEQRLGVRLFNRTTRRLAITDEGREYVERCRRILAGVDETEALVQRGAVEPTGTIAVTAPVQFGQLHVAPAVTRFVQHYERMRVSLQLHDRVVNLLEEGIDVGVRIGVLDDESLIAHRVGSLRRVVVAAPAYVQRHGLPAHPRELAAHECVCFTGGSAPGWSFVDEGKPLTVAVQGRLAFNQVAPAVDACVAGVGVGLFLIYQVAGALRDGRLQVLLERFERPPLPIHVVYPGARLVSARTRAFIDWIRRELRAQGHGAETVGGEARREA